MQWYEILIIVLAVIIVIVPIVTFFVRKKKGKSTCECGTPQNQCSGNCATCCLNKEILDNLKNDSDKASSKFIYQFIVDGMKCEMCESHINDAIRRDFQDVSVKSSRRGKMVTIISHHALNIYDVKKTITDMGYDVLN